MEECPSVEKSRVRIFIGKSMDMIAVAYMHMYNKYQVVQTHFSNQKSSQVQFLLVPTIIWQSFRSTPSEILIWLLWHIIRILLLWYFKKWKVIAQLYRTLQNRARKICTRSYFGILLLVCSGKISIVFCYFFLYSFNLSFTLFWFVLGSIFYVISFHAMSIDVPNDLSRQP